VSNRERRIEERLGRTLFTSPDKPASEARPAIWDLVVTDMRERDYLGQLRYGKRLRPFNGRDTLLDAYQEALDLAVYLRQAIYERDRR
jgi:hypothetical protein